MGAYIFEFIGTLILILLGDGVCAAVTLDKCKAKGAGWIVVTLGWGFAVMCGVFVAGPYSGAHLNPALTLALAVAGTFDWSLVAGYVIAQMLGAMTGALLVYIFYKDHYKITEDPEAKLGTFCTMPAIYNPLRNLFSEIIGTWLLVLAILMFATKGNAATVGLGTLGALPVTLLIMAIGISLGATTGYAINPARDLGPRITHALVMPKDKSGWYYAWIPVVGPVLGGLLAVGTYKILDLFVAL